MDFDGSLNSPDFLDVTESADAGSPAIPATDNAFFINSLRNIFGKYRTHFHSANKKLIFDRINLPQAAFRNIASPTIFYNP